jgi:hypothetical protein
MAHVQLLPLVGQVTKYRGPPTNQRGFLRDPSTSGIPATTDADIVPSALERRDVFVECSVYFFGGGVRNFSSDFIVSAMRSFFTNVVRKKRSTTALKDPGSSYGTR